MTTAYSYTRFSTAEQKKGASKSRQMDAAQAWCKKHGYTLSDDRFLDEGRSAFKGKHIEGEGDLKRFLSLVESGRIRPGSVLILESFDRFSRLKPVRSVKLFLDVITSGIGMVFTMTHDKRLITEKVLNDEPYILYSIVGEAQRAHSESAIKSERVKDAREKRRQRAIQSGEKIRVWTPPWCEFDAEKGLYKTIQARAKIVHRIFSEYLSGHGAFKISRDLNLDNIPTLGHGGATDYRTNSKTWQKKTVRDILKDARVIGTANHLKKENYFPVIISKDIFNRAQHRLTLKAVAKPTGGPVDSVGNLFTTVCRCAHCGQMMEKTITNKTYKGKITRYEYLVCGGARSGNRCSYKSVHYSHMEWSFLTLVSDDRFFAAVSGSQNKAENHLAAHQGELETVERQIVKLNKFIIGDDNPSETLVKDLKEFEAKAKELRKQVQIMEAQSKSFVQPPADFSAIKNTLSEKMKGKEFRLKVREYIQSVVETIKLETHDDYVSYQVEFKSGSVLSVVLWKSGKLTSEFSFQIFKGIRKTYDPKAVIFG